MNKDNFEDKLKQIKTEDIIWFVYIGIIFLSWYANFLETDYYQNKSLESKKKYQSIMIIIFSILLIVYGYFLKSSFSDMQNLKVSDSDKKKVLVYASFLGSLLIFISGIIFLSIAIYDDNLDVEIAFN